MLKLQAFMGCQIGRTDPDTLQKNTLFQVHIKIAKLYHFVLAGD